MGRQRGKVFLFILLHLCTFDWLFTWMLWWNIDSGFTFYVLSKCFESTSEDNGCSGDYWGAVNECAFPNPWFWKNTLRGAIKESTIIFKEKDTLRAILLNSFPIQCFICQPQYKYNYRSVVGFHWVCCCSTTVQLQHNYRFSLLFISYCKDQPLSISYSKDLILSCT